MSRAGWGFRGIVAVMLVAGTAYAQKCRQRDQALTDQVKALVADIEAGRRNDIKSVDAFLGALPEQMRQGMVFVADSRSLQESTVSAPRVLLKSPNSDVIISFGTDPALRGFDAIEMTVWNGETAKVEMAEIRFPEDSRDPRLRGATQAMVERNPQKCVICHGEDRNWVFDPYRIWGGHIPWTEDALNRGSIEVDWYKRFLTNISEGQSRWRHLRPMETAEEIDAALAATGRYQIKSPESETTQPNNTPSLDLSHQILIYNGCRVANELAERPDWARIQYAVAGATNGCDPATFLDEESAKAAREFFEERGIGVGPDGKFDYDALMADTVKKQSSLVADRVGRQQWIFEKYGNMDINGARAEVKLAADNLLRKDAVFTTGGNRFPGFENSQRDVTASRYLLEPLGIDVSRWSMAVDRETYSHVEFFDEITRAKPIADVWAAADRDCAKLAERSRQALSGAPTREPRADAEGYCPPSVLDDQATLLARQLEPIALRGGAQAVLRRCSGCHTSGGLGAPKLPFGDIDALEDRIARTKGEPGDFGERMWGRVSRYPEASGAMPARGDHLSNEDKVTLRAWINSIPARNATTPPTTTGSR